MKASVPGNSTLKGFCKLFAIALCFVSATASAQSAMTPEQEAAYTKTINERSAKIVSNLGITDSAKFKKVSGIIAGEYRSLNNIYVDRDAQLKAIKEQNAADKDAINAKSNTVKEEVDAKLNTQHTAFLKDLSKELSPEQIDKVKDGLTYNVLHVTYTAYQEMVPTLTDDQKKQILDWLTEAREKAMDAESSEKKHAWFGKYKGRINNYLSKSGIDMKQAEADWQKRIKEKQDQKS